MNAGRVDPEAGQVSILLVGLVAVALSVVLGVVGVTSVQLARIHLLDAADAAALDASDALDEATAYSSGVGSGVPLTSAGVAEAAQAHLASRSLPSRLTGWQVAPGTGTPDGRTAVVVLTGAPGSRSSPRCSRPSGARCRSPSPRGPAATSNPDS
ncbi:pilus assembly protein TadG-related protein [Ornithinimicrobium sp. CNJ-824]|uniref:pilus assembly protein TadG-related protein n=1 Tax=Ornithinimicrobium sp. CNJ-824 TaxID=1904966 RepID=UPI0009F8A4A7|nr:pilus assembly protein TadG-related protein [Ornithinimicrobium sp. CNJ-824]